MFRRVPTYEISFEAEEILQNAARSANVTPGRALSEAISLLALALEARRQGKRLAVLDQRGVPVNEITLEFNS